MLLVFCSFDFYFPFMTVAAFGWTGALQIIFLPLPGSVQVAFSIGPASPVLLDFLFLFFYLAGSC